MVERVHKLMGTKRRVRRPRGPSPLAGSSAATAITKRPRNPSPPSVDRSRTSQLSTCVADPFSRLSGFADLLSTPVTPEPRRWVRAVPLTGIVVESRGPASGCPLAGPAQAECMGPQTSAPCPGGTQAQGLRPTSVSSSGLTSAHCFPTLSSPGVLAVMRGFCTQCLSSMCSFNAELTHVP